MQVSRNNTMSESSDLNVAAFMLQRDQRQARDLFRRNFVLSKSVSLEGDHVLDRFQPDWNRFQNVECKELLPKRGSQKKTSKFLQEVVDILIEYVHKMHDKDNKILEFKQPRELKNIMDLEIEDKPQNLEQVLTDCRETLKYCVKTGHPRFFNQLSTGLDIIALSGEWLTATANTNMFTYEIAPVFTLMEDIVLNKMRECVGWGNHGDGIFSPGGAISNLYAVMVAHYSRFPESKKIGLRQAANRPVMFTSEHSHFSIKKAGAIIGIGTDNVIHIKTDKNGKMIPEVLRQEILLSLERGDQPFMVSATSGTTVLGAFDELNPIADICQEFKLWFHVDGAWGGGALVSQKYKHLLSGIERADSVTWNPHKLMGILLQCSAILIKHKGLLEACNTEEASYLFQPDKQYDTAVYDTGDKAIQCGRHNDVFKLWLTWRANGDIGFESRVNQLMSLSQYLQLRLEGRDGFEFVLKNPEFINVCFWYIPKCMRHLPRNAERYKYLDRVAPKIKALMMEKGTTMVGYQPLGNLPNFFRMITSNVASTRFDIDFLLDEVERLGEQVCGGGSDEGGEAMDPKEAMRRLLEEPVHDLGPSCR